MSQAPDLPTLTEADKDALILALRAELAAPQATIAGQAARLATQDGRIATLETQLARLSRRPHFVLGRVSIALAVPLQMPEQPLDGSVAVAVGDLLDEAAQVMRDRPAEARA